MNQPKFGDNGESIQPKHRDGIATLGRCWMELFKSTASPSMDDGKELFRTDRQFGPSFRGVWSMAHCICLLPGGFTLWSCWGLRQRSLPWQRCNRGHRGCGHPQDAMTWPWKKMLLVPWPKGPGKAQHSGRKPWNLHIVSWSLTWIYTHNRTLPCLVFFLAGWMWRDL